MPIRRDRGAISRPTLIWIVVAAFLIASGIAVYFAIGKGSGSAAPQGAPIDLDSPPPPPPAAGTDSGLRQSEDGRAQFADRDNPNRVAGETLYRRLDPLPRGRYALEEPQLWMYMKDGRALHVQAAKGNLKFFQGTKNKPESGRFEGGVIARMYAAGVASVTSHPDPKVVPPETLVYTDSIHFDLSVGEFTTEDVINLSTPEIEVQGEGMTIIYNEIRESVAQIELGAVGYFHHHGGGSSKKKTEEKKPAAAPQATPAKPADPATPLPPPPKIDLYTTNISGPVSLVVGTRSPQSISADRLLAWTRLIDGKLPPNAMAELQSKEKEASAPQPAPEKPAAVAAAPKGPAPASSEAPAPAPGLKERIQKLRVLGPGGIQPLTPIGDEDALMTWGGRLVAVAVEQAPKELEKEHVAAKFISESAEPVVLMDARSGATVLCGSAWYGATTAGAELIGKDTSPLTIADALGGHGELPALTLNLKSGIGQSVGKGFFNRRDASKKAVDGEPARERLAWNDQADFIFATGSSGAGLQSIREAAFTGGVVGVNNEAQVSGDYLKAWFTPSKTKDALLARVVVDGNALGKTIGDQEPQSLTARKFDLTFAPTENGDRSTPSLLVATGGVQGSRTELVPDEKDKSIRVKRDSKLVSDSLEATLGRDAKGNTIVEGAVAAGRASFERSDGIRAAGDEIRTTVGAKTVDVIGEKGVVASRGATLTGPDLHLDGANNGVLVKGAGSIDHVDPDVAAKMEPGTRAAIPAEQIGRSTITWTKGMRFDDASGEGEAVGEVVAITYPDPFTQNTVRGAQLKIQTAPAASRTKPTGEAKSDGDDAELMQDVKLLRAEAIAGEKTSDKTPKATAEQRTYVADDAASGGRRLEKLTYIEGPNLIADEEHGVFRVPAAGRALVMDHSIAKDGNKTGEGSLFASASSHGTTLMEWSGDMAMNRVTELADITGGVRITHKPLDSSDKPIILEADSVQARFKLASKSTTTGEALPSSPADQKKDQLVSTTAKGAVRIITESGDKELTADEATYHAMDGVIEASSSEPGSAVTILDKVKGVPMMARKLRWNVRTDAIDIIEAMPTVAPLK